MQTVPKDYLTDSSRSLKTKGEILALSPFSAYAWQTHTVSGTYGLSCCGYEGEKRMK
jgi:hypothetical protein